MIQPLPGYCLISPLEEEKKTSGGVFLPEMSKDKPMKGKVIACGRGQFDLVDCPVSVNDVVYYKKWVNETIKEDGKEYIFVKFEDLLGRVE